MPLSSFPGQLVVASPPAILGYFSLLKSGRGTKNRPFPQDTEIGSQGVGESPALSQGVPGQEHIPRRSPSPRKCLPASWQPGRQGRAVTDGKGRSRTPRVSEGCRRCDKGVAKGTTLAAQERTGCVQRDPNTNLH